jgi:uncharacterized integral membrane protein
MGKRGVTKKKVRAFLIMIPVIFLLCIAGLIIQPVVIGVTFLFTTVQGWIIVAIFLLIVTGILILWHREKLHLQEEAERNRLREVAKKFNIGLKKEEYHVQNDQGLNKNYKKEGARLPFEGTLKNFQSRDTKLSYADSPLIKNLFYKLPDVWRNFIDTQDSKELINFCNHLLSMKHENGNNVDFLPVELRYKASDCFVLIGQYENALEFFPLPVIGSKAEMTTNCLLSLKLATKNRLTGHEVLTLLGPKVTDFGKEHLIRVLSELNSILDLLWATTKVDYIAEWAKGTYKYQVGIGTSYGYDLTKHVRISGHRFSDNPKVIEFITNITREAENSIRQKIGVPRVGEGWVAETQLYYKIKQAFSNLDVQQHASPKWLGRQHLDIFIPSMSVGIEYQGEQHDQPVDFFGGQEAFIQIQNRDQRKLRLCKNNGVHLIYVRSGYTLQNIIAEIESISQSGVF